MKLQPRIWTEIASSSGTFQNQGSSGVLIKESAAAPVDTEDTFIVTSLDTISFEYIAKKLYAYNPSSETINYNFA